MKYFSPPKDSSSTSTTLPPQPLMPRLTQKEQEILGWCARGKTSAEMAIILNRSETTINFHIANLRVKFGVTSRHAAVLKAIKFGMPLLP